MIRKLNKHLKAHFILKHIHMELNNTRQVIYINMILRWWSVQPISLASPEGTWHIFLGPYPRLSEPETQKVKPNYVTIQGFQGRLILSMSENYWYRKKLRVREAKGEMTQTCSGNRASQKVMEFNGFEKRPER